MGPSGLADRAGRARGGGRMDPDGTGAERELEAGTGPTGPPKRLARSGRRQPRVQPFTRPPPLARAASNSCDDLRAPRSACSCRSCACSDLCIATATNGEKWQLDPRRGQGTIPATRCAIMRLKNGGVSEARVYFDTASMMRPLGVLPEASGVRQGGRPRSNPLRRGSCSRGEKCSGHPNPHRISSSLEVHASRPTWRRAK